MRQYCGGVKGTRDWSQTLRIVIVEHGWCGSNTCSACTLVAPCKSWGILLCARIGLCLLAVTACSFIAVMHGLCRKRPFVRGSHWLLDFERVANTVPAWVLNGGCLRGVVVCFASPLHIQLQASATHICDIQGWSGTVLAVWCCVCGSSRA